MSNFNTKHTKSTKMKPRPFFVLFVCFVLSQSSTGCSSKSKEPKNIVKVSPISEEELLEKATDSYDRGFYTLAAESWQELRENYPGTYYATLAELKLADSKFGSSDFPAAILAYEEFARIHPGHEAMPYVRYQIAFCNFQQDRGPARDQSPVKTSIRLFTDVAERYPTSIFATLSRRRIQEGREKLARHEETIARFYEKQGQYKASQYRLATLKQRYPDSEAVRAVESDPLPEPEEQTPQEKPVLKSRGTPKAPSLAYAPRFETIETDTLAKNAPDSGDAVASTSPSTLLATLQCEETNGTAIATAFLRRPVKQLMTESSGASGASTVFRAKTAVTGVVQPTSFAARDCENRFGKLVVRESLLDGIPSLTLETEPKSGDVRVDSFVLDRPDRLIVVMRSGQAS